MSAVSIYLIVVLVIGIISIYRMLKKLKDAEKYRIKRLRKKKRLILSIPNTDEDVDELEELRDRRIRGVETRFTFFRKMAIPGIVVVMGLLVAFPFLGALPRTFISLGLTAIGVTLGIACKTPIENLAAGVILSFTQPVRIGDTVLIDDEYGVIEDIGTIHTIVQLWDYRRLVVNNSVLLSKQLINYSLNDKYQWAYVEFWISYQTDLVLVEKLAKQSALDSPYFADYDDPSFWIMDFDKQGVKCWIAAWAESPREAWNLKCDMRTRLVKAFQENDVEMHTYRVDLLSR